MMPPPEESHHLLSSRACCLALLASHPPSSYLHCGAWPHMQVPPSRWQSPCPAEAAAWRCRRWQLRDNSTGWCNRVSMIVFERLERVGFRVKGLNTLQHSIICCWTLNGEPLYSRWLQTPTCEVHDMPFLIICIITLVQQHLMVNFGRHA